MTLALVVLAAAALGLALASLVRTRTLLIDPAYGCLTRRGLEARWTGKGCLLFFDIDDMRGLNKAHGYAAVDSRIAGALAATCRKGEAYAARWASGDELVIVLERADLAAIVLPRLQAALEARGLSAMYALAPAERSLEATVQHASDLVLAQKIRRDAGLALAVGS